MSKLRSPILSFSGSGKLGAITMRHHRSVTIAETIPQPKDVKSAGQLSWRTMFEKCTLLWHALSAADKQAWESLATPKHMTGYALWQSQCLRPNPGIYLPLSGGTMTGDIDMNGHAITNLPDPVANQDADTLIARNAAIASALYTQGARVYHNANQAIPTSTWTAIAFNSERWNTDTIHDTITNNSRLTCKTAGIYVITMHALFASGGTGIRHCRILLNAATIIAEAREGFDLTSDSRLNLTTVYSLPLNTYVEALVYQNSGGNLNIRYLSQYTPEFMMQRIG